MQTPSLFLPELGPVSREPGTIGRGRGKESKDMVVGLCPATEPLCDLLQTLGLGFLHREMGTAVPALQGACDTLGDRSCKGPGFVLVMC